MDHNHLLILAGGKGTRMNSEQPKVLQEIRGIPMISRVLKNVLPFFPDPAIVVGHRFSDIQEVLGSRYRYIVQDKQLGTGHAVLCAKGVLEKEKDNSRPLVVIPGDHPLLKGQTLVNLIKTHKESNATVTLATVTVPEFSGDFLGFYTSGRVVRGEDDRVQKIVELKDATLQQKSIREVNVSYYCLDTEWLWKNIGNIKKKNSANEYYLTDIVHIAVKQKKIVSTYPIENPEEGLGVNTFEQKLIVEKHVMRR